MSCEKVIFKLYSILVLIEIKIRYHLFGFESVNTRLGSLDKRFLIPVLREFGARIGKGCDIESPLIINAKGDYRKLSIGENCYLGKGVVLDLKGEVVIKNNVVISMSTTILSHIDVGKSRLSSAYPLELKQTILEDHCYVGAHSCILPGVRMRQGCVVGAGSVVHKDTEMEVLVAGSPAKVVKRLGA